MNNHLAWSPDSSRLMAAEHQGLLRLWTVRRAADDAEAGAFGSLQLSEGEREVLDVSWTSGGNRFVTTTKNGRLRLWSRDGDLLDQVGWSLDGERSATGADDGTVRLWDSRSGRELLVLKGHAARITNVRFEATGTRLLTGSRDGSARVWDIRKAGGGSAATERHASLVLPHQNEIRRQSVWWIC